MTPTYPSAALPLSDPALASMAAMAPIAHMAPIATVRQGRPLSRSRVHTRVACTTCKATKVRCEGTRPCRYCIKHQCADACVDSLQKKRGPKPKCYGSDAAASSSPDSSKRQFARSAVMASKAIAASQRELHQAQLRMLPAMSMPVSARGMPVPPPSSASAAVPMFPGPMGFPMGPMASASMPCFVAPTPAAAASSEPGPSSAHGRKAAALAQSSSAPAAAMNPAFPFVYMPQMMCPMPLPSYFPGSFHPAFYPYFPNAPMGVPALPVQHMPAAAAASSAPSTSSLAPAYKALSAIDVKPDGFAAGNGNGMAGAVSPTLMARTLGEKAGLADASDLQLASLASALLSAAAGPNGNASAVPAIAVSSPASAAVAAATAVGPVVPSAWLPSPADMAALVSANGNAHANANAAIGVCVSSESEELRLAAGAGAGPGLCSPSQAAGASRLTEAEAEAGDVLSSLSKNGSVFFAPPAFGPPLKAVARSSTGVVAS